MHGLTGSQTKSCTFKGLRDETGARDVHPTGLERNVTMCKYSGYICSPVFALVWLSWLFSSWDPLYAHIRAKHFRDHNRSISLLVILHNGNPGAAHSQSRSVKRVHEFALSAGLRLEADARAPRLKRFAVRTRRDFPEFVARGQPDFQVIGLRRSKAHVAGAEQHGAVVQSKLLQDCLGVAHQGFVFVVALVRMRELEEFHFLKLVLAQDAPRVFTRRAGFGAEAGSPSGHENRQLLLRERRVAIEVV